MNGIMNWIQSSYQSLMQTVGLAPKKPVTPAKPPQVAAENVKADSLTRGDQHAAAQTNKGGSALRLNAFVQDEKAAWNIAASGTKTPNITADVKSGKAPVDAIYDHFEKKSNLSPEQWDNVADFLKGVMEHGKVDSKNPNYDKSNLIDVLNEGVTEFGITEDQLKLMADGDFSVNSYVDMVRDGKSIG